MIRWRSVALALLLTAAYLAAWPVTLRPERWDSPPAADFALRPMAGLQRFAAGVGHGPGDVLVDELGRVRTGYDDGRIVELNPGLASYRERADTQGRPMGLAADDGGGLWIADARRGLLRSDAGQPPGVLTSAADGGPFRALAGIAYARHEQALYFTDASSRHSLGEWRDERLEHRASGRLLRYDLVTHRTQVVLDKLQSPAGVVLGPDEECLLVAEAGAYRVLRLWRQGPRAGEREVFADHLPGEPQLLSFNGRDRYWLALAPRDPLLDALAAWPALRRVLARLPALLQPAPEAVALALAFDPQGHVVAGLHDERASAYAPLSSVREQGAWLYLASAAQSGLARLPLQAALPDEAAPPPGSEQVPHRPQLQTRPLRDSTLSDSLR